jgi:acetoin utilization deacetylase AcuC-like enzyme
MICAKALLPRVPRYQAGISSKRNVVIRFKLDFVAHRRDPRGGLDLVKEDFTWATSRLMVIAERHANGAWSRFQKVDMILRATPARSPGVSRR